ncbi:CCA tRNA nucleotidyltransferase [Aliiroseovarius sp.]|uniref:CCA tRNA nucleotidyltransferase n=1 Tax=Aliiroseovarius sp. TaxID=1872442 RepID=UPI002637F854|nr:CCA tRNA nucleotidyltransferase [Aliiroseovarius sp.]
MTRITDDWLTGPAAQAVCAMLTDAGFQALFVGGCVRNTLLDVPISDIDISTDATPDQVIEAARQAGFKSVPTGYDHGTVTVVVDHEPFEITTFRKDVETDGRRAVVAFAKTAEEDAHRRDFTMNALYARPDGAIVDPLGGLADLRARYLRFIDNPEDRIREDYLRILRFFRFHAHYGNPEGGLDAEGLAAVAANSAGLETLSNERVGSEMRKLLSAPDPSQSVASMVQTGVLAHVLPGAEARFLPVLVHLEGQAGLTPNAMRRLTCLGGDGLKDRLRLSNGEVRTLDHLHEALAGTAGDAELAYRLGDGLARDVALLRAAMTDGQMPRGLNQRLTLGNGARGRFPVSAQDLMPAFQGAALGARLKTLEARWIASDFALTKEELLA